MQLNSRVARRGARQWALNTQGDKVSTHHTSLIKSYPTIQSKQDTVEYNVHHFFQMIFYLFFEIFFIAQFIKKYIFSSATHVYIFSLKYQEIFPLALDYAEKIK